MRLVKLHLGKHPIYVNPDHILVIVQHPGKPTGVFMTSGEAMNGLAVDETADEVVEACNVK